MRSNTIEHLRNDTFSWLYFGGVLTILFLPLVDGWPWAIPVPWVQANLFRILFILLANFFIARIILKDTWKLLPEKPARIPFLLLLGFGGILVIANLFSLDPSFSFSGTPFRGWGVLNDLSYIFFAVFLFLTLSQRNWEKVWKIALSVALVATLIAIIQYLNINLAFIRADPGRPASTFGNTMFFAIFLVALLPFSVSFLWNSSTLKSKILFVAFTLLLLFGIVLSGTRAAFVGLAVSTFFFFLFYPSHKSSKLLRIVALGLIGMAITMYLLLQTIPPPNFVQNSTLLSNIWQRSSLEEIIHTEPRFASWSFAIQALNDRPFFGYGPYNSSIAFDRYFDSNNPRFYGRMEGWWDTFHNFYLDLAVTTGFVGFLVFLGFLGSLFFFLSKKRVVSPEHTRAIHITQTAMVAYLTTMVFSFNSFATSLIFFMLIAYSLFLLSLPSPSFNKNKTRAS
ncbi:MAG: hypothetical protein A3C04_01755 [Candidatus Wildermuthbacteria bacterium RIFCSPHIGHO2_02_FULL_45_25]|uniref:O-antigen ligase-related domain-containing protein n=1 Tax=Candidatus Wildermuthbacteria bacterium RIFCSPHIGHO2_02_FULL_45_25 TaxID=1802450 RepID=A0A1G2R5I4_9BACT|nr:MAG: hypothetical protein A3C04_01755 [Candidatus Wildermuthbacteria bacterium RIFCSPHIGHO2_02_FULL_45_25]